VSNFTILYLLATSLPYSKHFVPLCCGHLAGRRALCEIQMPDGIFHSCRPGEQKFSLLPASSLLSSSPNIQRPTSNSQHPSFSLHSPFFILHSLFSILYAIFLLLLWRWHSLLALCCNEAYATRCISGNCNVEILAEKCVQIVRVLLLLWLWTCCCRAVVAVSLTVAPAADTVHAIGCRSTTNRGIQ